MSDNKFYRAGNVSAPNNQPTDHSKRRKAGIRAAMAQVKNGQTVPAEDVEAWVNSWDAPNELPPPEPRRR